VLAMKPPKCKGCPLATKGGPYVPGWGNKAGRHIIIGEGPGSCEDGTCRCSSKAHHRLRPFVGASGRRLTTGLGGDYTEVYLTNIRKCQAKEETKAEKKESIAHCTAAYLSVELAEIDAAQKAKRVTGAVVQPVGADATEVVMGNGKMMKMHGTCWTHAERDLMVDAVEHPLNYLEAVSDRDEPLPDDGIPF